MQMSIYGKKWETNTDIEKKVDALLDEIGRDFNAQVARGYAGVTVKDVVIVKLLARQTILLEEIAKKLK
jgi:hypothetical protein